MIANRKKWPNNASNHVRSEPYIPALKRRGFTRSRIMMSDTILMVWMGLHVFAARFEQFGNARCALFAFA